MVSATSLCSFWICDCIPKVWVINRTVTQKSHENGGGIFKKIWTVCIKSSMLKLSFDMQKLLKKLNWQLGCYAINHFEIFFPELHWNTHVCLSYPFLGSRDDTSISKSIHHSKWVQHHDGCDCLKTRLAGHALRLIRILASVSLARVNQARAWIRQSYEQ